MTFINFIWLLIRAVPVLEDYKPDFVQVPIIKTSVRGLKMVAAEGFKLVTLN